MKQAQRIFFGIIFILALFSYSPRSVLNLKEGFEVKAQTCQENGGVCLPDGEAGSCSKFGSGACPKYKICCASIAGDGPFEGDEANVPRTLCCQASGGRVGHKTHFLGYRQHSGTSFSSDPWLVVQYARHRRDRDAGPLSDVT